jgi:hypothetical protein
MDAEALAPATLITRKLSTNASPVPSTPRASTLPMTSIGSVDGAGGRPATTGATAVSRTVATSSWPAGTATADMDPPVRKRRW